MKLHITAWPRINGEKRQPGDKVEVEDAALARMLIREGQARPAGTPEPLAGGPAASQRAAQVDAGIDVTPAPEETPEETPAGAETLAGEPAKENGPPPKPGRGASHADWVAYAIGHGMDTDDAQGMTRAQLTAHFAGS